MFGKKAPEENKPIPVSVEIETIPQAFYGGADPLIYQSPVTKTASPETQISENLPPPPPPKVVPPRVTTLPKNTLQKPLPHNSKTKFWIIGGGILVVGVIAAYYLYPYFTTPAPVPETRPVVVPPVVIAPPVVTPPIVIPTTTPVEEPIIPTTTPVVRGGGTFTLPPISYVQILDDDKDTVSDTEEEEVFETDPGMWDFDKDGYYDGLEIVNLYNPKGIAPQKIIDSGLFKEYISPVWQYRLYYPSQWRVDSIDVRGDDILLSGSAGDYIEIRSFKKEKSTTFAQWFSEVLSTESYGTISQFQNRFKLNGYKRQDGTVAFYETDTAVYSIVYFFGEDGENSYPRVMDVLVQSFRPSKIILDIPVQPVLPGVEVPTSSAPSFIPTTSTSSATTTPSVETVSVSPTNTSSSPSEMATSTNVTTPTSTQAPLDDGP